MPFQPVPNTALIEWVYMVAGQIVENTYHMRSDVPFTAPELVTAAPDLYNWWGAELAPTISFDVTLLRVELKALDSDTAPFYVYTPGALAVGGAGVAAAANNVAFCIKHTTALSGRSGRGRWYLVGIPSTLVVNSAISLAQAALYTSAFPELDAVIATLGHLPVVVSRRTNNALRPTGITNEVTGHSFTDAVVDSQRRRLPGRGS